MTREEKIHAIVNAWVSSLDVSYLEDFYIQTRTEDLENWTDEDLDFQLGEI